jgi:hypothetical protein
MHSIAVPLFHHEDHIRPADVGGCNSRSRIVLGTRRANLNIWHLREQVFGGETTYSVSAAHEEKLRQAAAPDVR